MKIRVASAGTGKTASLVVRYLGLISSGTPLRRIAGVTFTRKSADELRSRVGKALEDILVTGKHLEFQSDLLDKPKFVEAQLELGGATLSTIHGFMAQCLRLTAPLLHLDPDFGLMGDWEARTIFEEEWQSLLYLATDPSHVLFSIAHPSLTEPLLHLFDKRSLAAKFDPGSDLENQTLVQVYETVFATFQTRLGAKMLSPSEIERRALDLIQNARALERLRERYQILLVDEFQDVNPLQGSFFAALRDAGLAIEVVGDPKQSIYAFRDADVEVFRQSRREGQELPPLEVTYRHSTTLVRFLNRLTSEFAKHGFGFDLDEAPPVKGLREIAGRLEIHWIVGESLMDELRRHEAQILTQRLKQLLRHYEPSQVAVLVRSRTTFGFLEEALTRSALPYILLQGRGYYERQEIRDLYHALRVGLDASGLSLAAWLRSPFAQLSLGEVERVIGTDLPERLLEAAFPKVQESLHRIRQKVRQSSPLEALKFLVREPIIAGKSYLDFLNSRARENVDALLFQIASRPPRDIEILLERLQLLSHQAEAGDVPQSGEGIQLLTVHGAKGLEWPVVAVFDLGRMQAHRTQPVYLGEGGRIALPDTDGFEEFRAHAKAKEAEESYRLLYVAASRARDVLLLSGSIKEGKPTGWAEALSQIGFGPEAPAYQRSDYVHQTHAYRPVPELEQITKVVNIEVPSWIDQVFEPNPHPPLFSPSALKKEEAAPLPLPDIEEGEEIPGRARAVGTLVHYAIGQNWSFARQEHRDNLEAQEVMFPFDPDERDSIMKEVGELLDNYERLKGTDLPWPRDEDYPEYPLAMPMGHTVWQGVIDRLYRVSEQWYLEDYKTDHEIAPERYHLQLGIYLEAIRRAWNIEPEVRLVYLRFAEVRTIRKEELDGALSELTS